MAEAVERFERGKADASHARVEQLECRECAVICERVVSPWRCLKSGHNCVYAFEEGATMYFGCVHKVFLPELDIAPFSEATGGTRLKADPYGPLRVFRPPLPQCPVTIERAYSQRTTLEECLNPGFVWRSRFGAPNVHDASDGGYGGSV